MKDFTAFGLPETLLTALSKIGFTEPTPIQAQAIPFALKGQDVLGTASTGTGKTAAFALPLITHLLKSPRSVGLIMTPTRELATQVLSTIMPLLLMHRDLHTACLIGGEPIGRQLTQLNRRPRLIVGTPGRINDHLARGSLWLDRADFLVLDETDRMLDMGFGVQIEKIITKMAKPRQTLMFSATLPKEIVSLSAQYLKNPQRISVGVTNKPAAKIKEEMIETSEGEKYDVLLKQLAVRKGSIIVFVKTRHGADRLATKLCKAEHKADAIHGDLQQRKRDRVIQGFRDQQYRILVATDVAARGLDIPHIEHVINYDLPQAPEDYIHRIGRTARAGAEGEAVNLVTPSERGKWRAIVKLMNPDEDRGGRSEQSGPRRAGGATRAPGKKFGDRNYRTDSRSDNRSDSRRDDRQPQQARGRSQWEGRREAAAAPQADRAPRSKTYGRNPFGYKDQVGEAYQEIRQQRDDFDRNGEGRGDRSSDNRGPRRPVDRDARRPAYADDRRPAARPADDRRPSYADDRRPARPDDRRSFGKKPSGVSKPFGAKKPGFGRPAGNTNAGKGQKRGRWAA